MVVRGTHQGASSHGEGLAGRARPMAVPDLSLTPAPTQAPAQAPVALTAEAAGFEAWRYRFEQVVAESRDAFIEVDGRAVVTGWNRRAEEILGWEADEVVGRLITDTILPLEYALATYGDMDSVVSDLLHRTGRAAGSTQELELIHRDGHPVLASGSMFVTAFGDDYRIGGFIHDLTEERAAEEALAHAYLHDPLTGLPNRALYSYQLAYAVGRSKAAPGTVAVVCSTSTGSRPSTTPRPRGGGRAAGGRHAAPRRASTAGPSSSPGWAATSSWPSSSGRPATPTPRPWPSPSGPSRPSTSPSPSAAPRCS